MPRLKDILPLVPDKFHYITSEGVFCNNDKNNELYPFPKCMLDKDEVVSISVHEDGQLVLKLKTVEK